MKVVLKLSLPTAGRGGGGLAVAGRIPAFVLLNW